MMRKDACMEMCICESLWLSSVIVFLCVCVSVIVRNAPLFVLLCVWLCAQTCWLVADNNTRGCVFVDLLAEEIPTVLSVSGLCVFSEVARVTPPAVLFSCWPPQPYPALVPCRPLLPSEACSSSDKSRAGQTLSRAPQSPSELLHANNTPSFPIHAHTIYMWKHWVLSPVHWSYGTTAKCACLYVCEQKWPWERAAWVNASERWTGHLCG